MTSNELLKINSFLESLGEVSTIEFESSISRNGIEIEFEYKTKGSASTFKKEISKILKSSFSSIRVLKSGTIPERLQFSGYYVDFIALKKVKKKPKSGSGVIPTAIQEKGTTFILNQVLKKNKNFKKEEDILSDKDTADGLRKIFKGYENRLTDWIHSYYEQQKEFLKKFSNSKWDEFKYGGDDFVTFFSKQIKNVARSFDPTKPVGNYTTWNPSDIWAVYDMNNVKKEIERNLTPKTQNLVELNNLLIKLFEERRLVGLSLKKIAENKTAKLKFVNIDSSTMKFADIENYNMNDLKFNFSNIFIGEKVTTYIKYGRSNDYTLNITKAGNNLSFNTAIRSTPAAQGGQTPIKMLIELLNRKGRSSFKNDHKSYPSNAADFIRRYDEFETMYKELKKVDTTIPSFSEFKDVITLLYSDGKSNLAILKLMTLHFFSDALKNNLRNPEFWTDLLYYGMKVGNRFAPHAKIS